jgi:SSS family solute:Na+ symporter
MNVTIADNSKAITDILGINFMMQAWWKFVLCSLLFIVVSFVTPKPSESQMSNCINLKEYWQKTWSGITDYRIIGFAIFALLLIIWITLEIVA